MAQLNKSKLILLSRGKTLRKILWHNLFSSQKVSPEDLLDLYTTAWFFTQERIIKYSNFLLHFYSIIYDENFYSKIHVQSVNACKTASGNLLKLLNEISSGTSQTN